MVGMGWGGVRFFDDFPGFYEVFIGKMGVLRGSGWKSGDSCGEVFLLKK